MHTLTVPAVMERFKEMNDFIERESLAAGFDRKTTNKILLAGEEILVNVIHYAYSNGGDLTISCGPAPGAGGIVIEISDSGVAFNPLDAGEPDLSLPVEERPIGGLGIFMVKNIMDEVRYKRENGRNVFTMTKRLPGEGSADS
jgi:serine/threonine-protein kinase RsbW